MLKSFESKIYLIGLIIAIATLLFEAILQSHLGPPVCKAFYFERTLLFLSTALFFAALFFKSTKKTYYIFSALLVLLNFIGVLASARHFLSQSSHHITQVIPKIQDPAIFSPLTPLSQNIKATYFSSYVCKQVYWVWSGFSLPQIICFIFLVLMALNLFLIFRLYKKEGNTV